MNLSPSTISPFRSNLDPFWPYWPQWQVQTTTIKAIATLIEPTYGEIMLGDISALHQPEEARRILGHAGLPPVYDDLRVEEFAIFLPMLTDSSPKPEREKSPRSGSNRIDG